MDTIMSACAWALAASTACSRAASPSASRPLTHRSPQALVGHQRANGVREGVAIAGLDQDARDAMHHILPESAGCGTDHRKAGGHGLERYESTGLGGRREDEERGRRGDGENGGMGEWGNAGTVCGLLFPREGTTQPKPFVLSFVVPRQLLAESKPVHEPRPKPPP